ncbi:redox-sensitive transcriptional activator SoxR [Sphingosinicella sp. CPCC 101087]|uniref:redox-sensitive transcriptional activator SoxR n=1 Tax=Sphingosinicella sp. CPCC 101087 TaxID=2497754 RepID=UPI00101B76CE|nr:redox-sensitive transcriptional activator SoxR [Sphingosinicella sp. CPCC 101087]
MPDRDPAPKLLTVGEVARRSGVAVSAVHFYERKGLIGGWRSSGNQRRYGRGTLRRIAIVKVAQQLGISLAEIGRRLASLPDDRTPAKADWARLAEAWRGDLDRRIVQLTRLRDNLDGCIGCGCLSMETCPLRNPDDALAARGPGPHYLDASKPLD